MNRFNFASLSIALTLWALPVAYAHPKPTDASVPVQAMAIFEQIQASSADIADVADRLEQNAKIPAETEMPREGLDTIKGDVNSIGSELKTLDEERASLSPWEVEALDRTISLMQEVAADTQKAIETYNSDRGRLWSTPYDSLMTNAYEEANQVKTLLTGYLKLAKARDRVERLEQ
jgi:hypothetical protein